MSSFNGFGNAPQERVLACDVRVVPLPSGVKAIAYRFSKKHLYTDFDDLLASYGVKPEEPALRAIKFVLVRAKGSHPENGARRGITLSSINKVLEVASRLGNAKGRVLAKKDMDALMKQGIQTVGIDHAVVENGRLIPVDKTGTKLHQFAMDADENKMYILMSVHHNQNPFFKEMLETLDGVNFYSNICNIASRRMDKLKSNNDIAAYLAQLLGGMSDRQPTLLTTNYPEALVHMLFDNFSDDRRLLIMTMLQSGNYRVLDDSDFLFDDLMEALERSSQDLVIAPSQSEKVLNKEDLMAIDHVWMGARRVLELAQALEQMERENEKNQETD